MDPGAPHRRTAPSAATSAAHLCRDLCRDLCRTLGPRPTSRPDFNLRRRLSETSDRAVEVLRDCTRRLPTRWRPSSSRGSWVVARRAARNPIRLAPAASCAHFGSCRRRWSLRPSMSAGGKHAVPAPIPQAGSIPRARCVPFGPSLRKQGKASYG